MENVIKNFFVADHERIDALLDAATADAENIDMDLYHQFRVGILTHIKMEEKILFPAAQYANGGVPLPLAAELRLEHGAITSLMVPPPTPDLIKVLKYVLHLHDDKEERRGGMYDKCAELTESETESLLRQLQQTTPVPVHPHNLQDYALDVAKRALTRAGYDYDAIAAQ